MPKRSLNLSAWILQDEPSEPRKDFLELPPVWQTMRPRSADVTVDVADVVMVEVGVVVTDVLVCAVSVADVVAVVVCVDEIEFDCVVDTVDDAVLVPVEVMVLDSEVVAVDDADDVAVELIDVVAVLDADVVADEVWVVVTVVFLQFDKAPSWCVLTASFKASATFLHIASVSTLSTRVSELHEMEPATLESSNQCSTRSERRVAVVLHSVNVWVNRSTCKYPTLSMLTHRVLPCEFPPPGQSSRRLLIIGICSTQSSGSATTKNRVVLPSSASHVTLGKTAVVTVVVADVVAVVVPVLDAVDVTVLVAVVFSHV